MRFISSWFTNDNTRIHYIDSYPVADRTWTPLVICPGLSETAEEYVNLLEDILPRRGIVLSFRGRGQSDSPAQGYDIIEHVQDLEGLVEHLSLHLFHLFAYSRGVSYAIGYTSKYPQAVKSLLLQDYPPEHKQMSAAWAEDYINEYLIPHRRTGHITQLAVRGIARDSKQVEFKETISCPLLILRGMLEGSLVSNEDVEKYKQLQPSCKVVEFEHSGHDIRSSERDKQLKTIQSFMESVEE